MISLHQSGDPGGALRALAASLAGAGVLAAAWAESGGVRAQWPRAPRLPREVARAAAAGAAPAVVPADCPGPGGEPTDALLLPLAGEGGEPAALVLLGRRGRFGEAAGWAPLAQAFAGVAGRHERLRAVEAERDTLRQRAEESEALHVLGLAANRTLDPDEVLTLVARFTRSLLGAHYVTVNTLSDGRIRTVAAVGLHGEPGTADDPFAARVAEAGKPLVVQARESETVAEPFHAAEGMRAGLGVPLALFGETFGALVIGYRRPAVVEARDTRLAVTLAGHAAVAISNARLHRALAERSRELERANEELRWSTEAKDRFFASMSHELRTPLNAILGYQSLMLEGVVGEVGAPLRPFLEKAHRATRNLLLLVNDVLDLSKLAAGKMELVQNPTRLRAVVEEAIATIEPMAAVKDLPIEVRPTFPTLVLFTDADRVRQILINLLSNAVKFTDAGRVTVSVVGHADGAEDGDEPVPEGWVEFRVADTGPGIPLVDQERIFHEFEQIVGATSRGGTGLGLPISRKLARLLGGDLLVRSAPGHGSVFTLRLPVKHDGHD